MRIIEPSYEILTEISEGGIKELQHIIFNDICIGDN